MTSITGTTITMEQRFFTSSTGATPLVKALQGYLKIQNDSLKFLEKTVKQIGYPRWDKAISYLNNSSSIGIESDSNNLNTTYIPFVRDSQNYVNALMEIRTINTDTIFRYLCDWQYTDTTATGIDTDVFAFFMMKMDKHVFGHDYFKITDSTIFNGHANRPSAIRLIDSVPPLVTNVATPVYYEICFVAYGPEYACGWIEGGCQSGQTSASCFNWCRDEISRQCFTGVIWEDEPLNGGGTGGGTGGTGGGGSGGGGIPPNCGGPTSGNRIEGNEPCEPGWEPIEPIEDDPPPPCDSYMTTLGNDSNFAAKFKSLTDTSVLNRNYEKGFYIADRTANSYISVQGTPGSPSIYFNGATLPMDGFLHSHTNPLNQAPMFSPDDVLLMAEAFLKGIAKDSNNYFIGLAHDYGPPYLLKITNTAKFRKFAEKIMKMEKEAKLSKRFTKIYQDFFRTANTNINEKGFLSMMNIEKAGNGLTLYRAQNNDCKKWIKLEKDNFNSNGVEETPCN
ncbi:MAG: hypothetical protein IPN82_07600 [Chitinophagaceae bacterium]|nr:hypothetical protein [Chitinophagaceae bacterium]MBK8606691.1 hypothetical protein [Chitinophagaceae bacterium]MBP6476930.1 hypothetical protein [Chitinophagaceae bacterium]MBP7107954.1 hypothetical protein [Chitinophagaceae bacterium]MBP7314028.1 hypothetical protein [Chitinophagaceae bacterium]